MGLGRLRLRAWIALAAFLCGFAVPLASMRHLAWDDDLACETVTFSGHPVSQVENPQAPVQPEHCALCHWWRALGSTTVGDAATDVVWLQPVHAPAVIIASWSGDVVVSPRSSRAPPVL